MTDDPVKIMAAARRANPEKDFIFDSCEPSQFYISFRLFGKVRDSE